MRTADGRFAIDRLTGDARETFLSHLAATAHVERSAEVAGFGVWAAYDLRRRDPAFAHEWRMALLAGYDRIEAALIRRALGLTDHAPVIDAEAIGRPGEAGELDVSLAISLLYRRRPMVERAFVDAKAEAFRASRDAAAETLLAKLDAYAKRSNGAAAAPGEPAANRPGGTATGEIDA